MDPSCFKNSPLPPELIYDFLLDIYAEYLHQAIITPDTELQWNPFTVLPAVSRLFHVLSQPVFQKIFGEEADEPIK